MHYSDHAFGKYDADGNVMKTMEAVNTTSGSTVVMGNRMGLTHQDARQVGSMYDCLAEIDDFKLCTPDADGCTTEDCGCHQDASALDEIIKTTDDQGCNRCLKKCPAYNYGTSGPCGCPEGLQHGCFEAGGTEYCYCREPTTTTTTTTTSSTTTTTTTSTSDAATTTQQESGQPQSEACKPDEAWWCEHHVDAKLSFEIPVLKLECSGGSGFSFDQFSGPGANLRTRATAGLASLGAPKQSLLLSF